MYAPGGAGRPEDAARLLADAPKFRDVAETMIEAWPVATAQHLTDTGCNRRAWVGQASCAFAFGCTRLATIHGWFTLTAAKQDAANAVADEIIARWVWGWEHAETLFG
jgi:hypothetical protein